MAHSNFRNFKPRTEADLFVNQTRRKAPRPWQNRDSDKDEASTEASSSSATLIPSGPSVASLLDEKKNPNLSERMPPRERTTNPPFRSQLRAANLALIYLSKRSSLTWHDNFTSVQDQVGMTLDFLGLRDQLSFYNLEYEGPRRLINGKYAIVYSRALNNALEPQIHNPNFASLGIEVFSDPELDDETAEMVNFVSPYGYFGGLDITYYNSYVAFGMDHPNGRSATLSAVEENWNERNGGLGPVDLLGTILDGMRGRGARMRAYFGNKSTGSIKVVDEEGTVSPPARPAPSATQAPTRVLAAPQIQDPLQFRIHEDNYKGRENKKPQQTPQPASPSLTLTLNPSPTLKPTIPSFTPINAPKPQPAITIPKPKPVLTPKYRTICTGFEFVKLEISFGYENYEIIAVKTPPRVETEMVDLLGQRIDYLRGVRREWWF